MAYIKVMNSAVTVLLVASIFGSACARCPYPTRIKTFSHAGNQTNFVEGDRVRLTCFPGYVFEQLGGVPEVYITCTLGAWLPATTTCILVTCDGLPPVVGARVLYIPDRTMRTVSVENGRYPFGAVVNVFCDPGLLTPDGRSQYPTTCTSTGRWSDTTNCSVAINQASNSYVRFRTMAVIMNVRYIEAYSNKDSQQYRDLVESLQNALFRPMSGRFHSLYVGAEDFTFSEGDGGIRVSFSTVFQPTLQLSAEALQTQVDAALAAQGYTITDPITGRRYNLQAGNIAVSRPTAAPLFTEEATIGLSVGGALVGLMALVLLLVCCCCGDWPCSPVCCRRCCRKAPNRTGPYTTPPRPLRAPAPYVQLPIPRVYRS